MSLKMTKVLAAALAITSTGAQAAVRLNESPLLGGGGMGGVNGGARNAFLELNGAVGGSGVILLQGHDGPDAPAADSTGWYTLSTLNASSPLRQEVEIAEYVRLNITTAGTGTITARLSGVQ